MEIGSIDDMRRWLTEDGWIVFGYGGERFVNFLENKYFPPGTQKNAEFEVAMGSIMTPTGPKITLWFRIKDTKVNRKNLKKALKEFYGSEPKDFDKKLNQIKLRIKQNLDEWFPRA